MRYLSILLLLLSLQLKAQWSVGVFAEPTWQMSSLSDGYPEYDSIKELHNNDFGFGYGLEIKKNINRFSSIHIRPGYYQFGFGLTHEDLQYKAVVHPQFGPISDLSQGAIKMAYMHHQFKYAGIQIDYQKDISPKTKDLGVDFLVGGGLSYFKLLDHSILLKTEGFAIEGDFQHTIKEDLFFEASEHMIAAQALFETVYHPKASWDLYAQLNIKVPFTAIARGTAPVYNWMPALAVGFRKQI